MSTPSDADRQRAAEVLDSLRSGETYNAPWVDDHCYDGDREPLEAAIAQALADERDRAREEPRVAPGWLLAAIADARGTHDCPVCNAGRPIPDGVTCPLCAGWTTI